MQEERIERNLPKALISWYDFAKGSRALFISGGNEECEPLFEALKEKSIEVLAVSVKEAASLKERFDYIMGAGIIEKHDDPVMFLRFLHSRLKPGGKLLLGTENRLGIRYFCGDKDVFTGEVFDGIDGYLHVGEKRMELIGGRAYSKAELKRMVLEAGFTSHKFYSVMPALTRPQMLISEDYLPNEPIDIRVFPQYGSPETVFLEEERLYQTLIENHMFHPMANAYLLECCIDGEPSDYDQITVQGDRSPREALATLIRKDKEVRKKALYPAGEKKVKSLAEKNEYLLGRGIPMTAARIEGDSYVMPYVKGEIATDYFQKLLQRDRGLFLRELEKFRELILDSSEHVPYEKVNWRHFEPYWEKRRKDDPNRDKWEKLAFGTEAEKEDIGVILRRGFMDMVSLNCFHTPSGFLFFDQEYEEADCPANAIFLRTLDIIYSNRGDLELLYPREEVMKYFHLSEHQDLWRRYAGKFLGELRNEKELSVYHRIHRRDWKTVIENRYRMNYSQEAYERLFLNIFKGAGNKKLFLFGSGRYAQRFLEEFAAYYEIAGILDNDKRKWGKTLEGIQILAPSALKEQAEPFKVIVCIRDYEEIITQLKEMAVRDCSVYDPRLEYEKPLKPLSDRRGEERPKPYRVGYVAGVFDLFHIGHLNLLRRAKEQCDYLIAGVVTDKQVINDKRTRPNIPFEERMEIVQACRYVDRAVEIPSDRHSTEDAYYMYHFDAQFSGSDYEDDPYWLAQQAFLRRHGSDLVFFPYTEGVSSTQRKEQIGENK